jgi:putative aldouronate transport system permease protein
MLPTAEQSPAKPTFEEWRMSLAKRFRRDRAFLLMLAPVIAFFVIFHYVPMYGALIAFKEVAPGKGYMAGKWIWFANFELFFSSIFFWRLLRNTFVLSFYSILFGFPIPILFALALNGIRTPYYKRFVQSASYLPHFISTVIVVGMMVNFLSPVNGVVNQIIKSFGGAPLHFFNSARWFRPLYVGSEVWQSFGWGSIIYLAALTGINPELYEAATVDGASRLQRMWHIDLPGILPTIMILLILRMGGILAVGFERIILMYNPATYEVADVIQTYVYRRGVLQADVSFATAVGLFNSTINLIFLVAFNRFSRRITEISLW